jgi:hypothetical protein
MKAESLQIDMGEPGQGVPGLARKNKVALSVQGLQAENRAYTGSGGVSHGNRHRGFTPAYLDTLSGIALPSQYDDGIPAPIHILDGLPAHWVMERDRSGKVLRARPGVIAGFLREGRFYTREEAAALTPHYGGTDLSGPADSHAPRRTTGYQPGWDQVTTPV